MDRERENVWVVCRERGSILIPVVSEHVAEVFRKAGWQVTELPYSAFLESGLRCLGIKPEDEGEA